MAAELVMRPGCACDRMRPSKSPSGRRESAVWGDQPAEAMPWGDGSMGGAAGTELGTSFSAPVGESDLLPEVTNPSGGEGVAYLLGEEMSLGVMVRQRFFSHACLRRPGPPNLGLSRQFWHWPQSERVQGPHWPHRCSVPRFFPPSALPVLPPMLFWRGRPTAGTEGGRSGTRFESSISPSRSARWMSGSKSTSSSSFSSPAGSKNPKSAGPAKCSIGRLFCRFMGRGATPTTPSFCLTWMQRREKQACFFTPAPPKRGLSRQLAH
mmetsp:Transcript_34231/g.68158  ORF Transcript_34231/g.68158 Transcript_34231/m.68158 type:complete len:266 (+) Transcript_34231:227-1024(+)